MLIVVFSYFFVQLNFELASHNFGSKFFFFFNSNLFFAEILVFALFGLACAYRLTQTTLSDGLLSSPSHRVSARPPRSLARLALPSAICY